MAGKAEIQKKGDSKAANDKNLNLAISGINKQFGPGALVKLGMRPKWRWIKFLRVRLPLI